MTLTKLEKIKDRIRKWEFVEGVKTPTKMPSFFGFKEQGLFRGYNFIIITEIDSNDFLSIYGRRLRSLGLEYEALSVFSVGVIKRR